MFYSHEVLTSQKHGVATIWLVATLGPRTTSRKVNRKAILGVNVPRACDTIMNPEAPMALRLQASLLYGISMVYSRQCLYILTDVQSMLDKMKVALKVVHGGGLNSNAGKAKPEELIVPYDPAFIPEFILPGLDVDLLKPPETILSQPDLSSSLFSSRLDASSPSQTDHGHPQLEIRSPSFVAGEIGGYTFPNDIRGTFNKSDDLFGYTTLGEESMLLRPDFEFDEEGNIVGLDVSGAQVKTPEKHQDDAQSPEDYFRTPKDGDAMGLQDYDPFLDDELDFLGSPSIKSSRLLDPDYVEGNAKRGSASYGCKNHGPKKIRLDTITQITHTELVQWEQDYLRNMFLATKKRSYSKHLNKAKNSAAMWVSGRGIASIGLVFGDPSFLHPLQSFCGERLLAALSDGGGGSKNEPSRKRQSSGLSEDILDGSRRVRRKNSESIEMGLTRETEADTLMQKDVELGRDAPAPLLDDNSSRMPWNITASLQGSITGSSSVSRPYDSFDRSSHRYHGRSNKSASRLFNLSPLAGRGLHQDLAGHDRLSSLSLDDFGDLDDNETATYMGHDILLGHADPFFHVIEEAGAADTEEILASLGNADRNFFEFLESRVQAQRRAGTLLRERTSFSEIFPVEATPRSVATQALIHVLSLATKNVIQVSQRWLTPRLPYRIEHLGDIYLTLRS